MATKSFTEAQFCPLFAERGASIRAMRRSFLSGLLGFAVLSCACASPAPASEEAGTARYRGLYVFGFETSSFVHEGAEHGWWAEATPDARQALHAAAPPMTQPNDAIYVRAEVEGELSAPGQYGHLGGFERRLFITRVLSAVGELRSAP